jgi:hypothetical protein
MRASSILYAVTLLYAAVDSSSAFAQAASASGTTIPPAPEIVDGSGNVWMMPSLTSPGNIIYENRSPTTGDGSHVAVLYYGGTMYAENTGSAWYQWTGSGWTYIAGGDPQPSASGTTVPPATEIVDGSGNVWTMPSLTSPGNIIYENGIPTTGDGDHVLVLYDEGTMYAENTGGVWYQWTGSSWTYIASDVTGGGGGMTAVLIQHIASSTNPAGNGISGNNFKIPLQPTLAGDCLVLGISYQHGQTITIRDNKSETWPAAAADADAGSGNQVAAVYVMPNVAAGVNQLTVSANTVMHPFAYRLSEFNNCAASSPVNGTNAVANIQATPAIDPGNFTPTSNNNASGGNIIWTYVSLATGYSAGKVTIWGSGTNFTPLDGDIAWGVQGFPQASQWYVQASQAAVDPVMTSTGDTSDIFNSVSVAIKVASAGGVAPSGIHVEKILHFTGGSGTSWKLQTPVTGNLRVLTSAGNSNLTGITNSDSGCAWVHELTGATTELWYAANCAANPNLTLTLNAPSINGSVRFYDVQGAATSPFDTSASVPPTACSAPTVNNQPILTPTTANGLTIARMSLGQGPGLGFASGAPAGALFVLTTYTGETDFDTMENADAEAILYNADTSTEDWNWTITNSTSCDSVAAHFR